MLLTPEDIDAIAEAVIRKLANSRDLRKVICNDLAACLKSESLTFFPHYAAAESAMASYKIRGEVHEDLRLARERRKIKTAEKEARFQKKSAIAMRTARSKANLTQEQLSESSGIPLAIIRAFERGSRIPNKKQADLLARVLNVTDYKIFRDL